MIDLVSNRPSRFVLIIGAMKCGTTSVFSALKKHPQICGSIKKEPQFLSQDAEFAKGEGYYFDLFPWGENVHKIAIEASTDYTKPRRATRVVKNIQAMELDCKFVYLVRDPVARIKSHYLMAIALGWPIKAIAEGIDRGALESCRYHHNVQPYLEAFGRESLLVLRMEDVFAQPLQNMRLILNHCGVDAEVDLPLQPLNYSPVSFMPYLKNQLEYIGSADAESEIQEMICPSEKQIIELRRELREDMFRLNQDFGVDVSDWV